MQGRIAKDALLEYNINKRMQDVTMTLAQGKR